MSQVNVMVAIHERILPPVDDKFNYYDASQVSKFHNIDQYRWANARGDLSEFNNSSLPLSASGRLPRPSVVRAPGTGFPFFALLPELRSKILEMAFTDHIESTGKYYDDTKAPFTTTVIVDRTDEDPRERQNRLNFKEGYRSGHCQVIHEWSLWRDNFEGICIYFPPSLMKLFVSKQFFEEGLKAFAKVTPLDITISQLDRVDSRLERYPILQQIIRALALRTRSLTLSTVSLDVPRTLSFPAGKLFQQLRVVNLFGNKPLRWLSDDGEASIITTRHAKYTKALRSSNHFKVTIRDALEHDEHGKCFEALPSVLRPFITNTQRFQNAQTLLASFRKHDVHPRVLFWQLIEYGLEADFPRARKDRQTTGNRDCVWQKYSTVRHMAIAVDVKTFEIVHFAAAAPSWSALRDKQLDVTFRTGRDPKLQSSLKAAFFGKFARKYWPDMNLDLTEIEQHGDYREVILDTETESDEFDSDDYDSIPEKDDSDSDEWEDMDVE